jgi:lipopolysaccharide export system permease protein
VGSLLLMDQVIPWSFGNIERIVALSMENIFLDMLRTQNQLVNKDLGISITVMDVRDRTLIWPTFRYSPNGRSAVTMQAREARLDFDLPRQQVVLKMQHGHVDVPGESRLYFESEEKPFPLPSRTQRLRARNLRIRDIQAELAASAAELKSNRENQAITAAWILSTGNFERLAQADYVRFRQTAHAGEEKTRRLNTELHNRFATSCSCLFFVLLGSPFAMVMARKQFLTSFLFCFTPILVVYYPVSMMTQNLSKTGKLDPAWAVWLANGLMGLAALYFIRRVQQH